jgi:ABC-type nitrate/sulfonate/bicarbonate transport system substrate-binding protein
VKTNMRISIVLFTVVCLWSGFYSAEAQLIRVRISHPNENVAWFPIYVAIKKGIFAKHGLEILMVQIPSRLAITALATREIEYISTLGTPMNALSRGLSGKVVMINNHKPFFVLVTRQEIKSAKDLQGRTVAVSQIGGAVDLSLLWILESLGLKRIDINVLPAGTGVNAFLLLRAKKVDAAMVSVPADLVLEREGFKPMVYLKDLVEAPTGAYIALEERVRKNRDEIKRLIMGTLEGITYTKTRWEEVIPFLKDFLKLDNLELAGRGYDRIKDIWPDDGMASEESLRRTATLAGIAPDMPISQLFDWSILKEAVAGLR